MKNRMLNRNTSRNPAKGAPLVAALSLGLAGALLAAPSAHAAAAADKADSFLRPVMAQKAASGWSLVIVKVNGGLTAVQEASLKSLGADITRRLPFIQSVTVRVPTRNLANLAALPFVKHLSADLAVKKCDEFTTAASGANSAYQDYGLTGKGVGVAVIDSGIYPYADLANGNAGGNRVIYAPSFVPGDYSPADYCGHGTHVAGIIAGNGQASTGPYYTHTYHGIARQANIIGVRVLDAQGQGSVTATISGIQWAVQNKSAYNIRVINLSLGHPVGESYTTDPLCQAVEAAWKAGIVVVCAAGNSGRANTTQAAGGANEGWGTAYGTINSPGNDPYVITVGATKSMDGNRWHDRIATYSGRGPSRLDLVLKPDIIAPGNKVISLGTTLSYLYSNFAATNQIPLSTYCPGAPGMSSSTYFVLSGTSMAAPVVAGAAALLLQANPSLSPDTIKARLMISADKWASPTGVSDPCTYGAGYLDIPAALQNTAIATKPALSPALTQDASGNVYLNASRIMSATHIIWGTSVNDLHIIWGTNAISGSSALTASHIIWGTSVFSDHIIWGTSASAVDLTSTAIYGE